MDTLVINIIENVSQFIHDVVWPVGIHIRAFLEKIKSGLSRTKNDKFLFWDLHIDHIACDWLIISRYVESNGHGP